MLTCTQRLHEDTHSCRTLAESAFLLAPIRPSFSYLALRVLQSDGGPLSAQIALILLAYLLRADGDATFRDSREPESTARAERSLQCR